MSYLQAVRGSERFVLLGICSGANVSFRTACRDSRVAGGVLINAHGHLHDSQQAWHAAIRRRTMARHYRRLAFSRSFGAKNWRKAVTGHVDYKGVRQALVRLPLAGLLTRQRQETAGVQQAVDELAALSKRGVRLLHVCSEGDAALDYLHVVLGKERLRQLQTGGQMEVVVMHGANHTFTLLWSQERLLQVVRQWVQEA
jgi:hypothetical protein